MSSMINTNIASLSAQRNLSKSQDSLATALQRLSSGLRINSAKDDAAGLAISTRMTSQINGMNQAIRNANDGISLAQTADSSLDEVTNNLQRIRDLALQAANGTNSDDDRAALDVEVQQRLAEVNRIASQTTFNGINLLDGTFTSQAFQIGASANQTVTIDKINSAKTSDLGLGAGTATGTALASTVATTGIAAGSLSINGSTVTTDATTNSAKALAAAINGNATITASGVTAVATNQFAAAFTTLAVTNAGQQGSAVATEQLSTAAGQLTSSTGALGTFVSTSGTSNYTLSVTSATGTTTIESAVAGGVVGSDVDTALATSAVKNSLAQNGITVSGSAAAGTLQFTGVGISLSETGDDAGLNGSHNKGFTANQNVGITVGTASVPANSLTINGTTIDTTSSLTTSAAQLAATINNSSATTNVTANATSQTVALGSFTTTTSTSGADTYTLSVTSSTGGKVTIENAAAGGTAGTDIDTALTSATVAQNLVTAGISFTGTAAAGTLKFSTNDGANITLKETFANGGGGAGGGFESTINGNASIATGALSASTITTGTVSLHSTSDITIGGQNPSVIGLNVGKYAGSTEASVTPTVSSLDVSGNIAQNGLATKSLKINGTDITVTTQANVTSAKDLASVINAQAGTTGVYATAQGTNTAQLGSFTTTTSTGATDTYSLSVSTVANGATTTVNLLSAAAGGTQASDVDAALANSTIAANLATAGITFTGTAAAGTLQFQTSDGSNIKINESLANAATGGFTQTVNGASSTFTSNVSLASTSAITIADGSAGGTATAASAGFTTGTYGGVAAGSLTLNGTTITTDSTTVGADKLAAAINNQSTTTGVSATALATDTGALNSFKTTTNAGYGLVVNGVTVIDSTKSGSGVKAADIDTALATSGTGTVGANLAAAGITFTGTAAGGDLHFYSAAGADINIAETQGVSNGVSDAAGFNKKQLTSSQQFSSTITLSSSAPFSVGGTNPSVVGLTSGTFGIVNQTGSKLSSTVASSGMSSGDLSVNGTTIVTDGTTNSAKALAAAINNKSDSTNVTAVANATVATGLGQFKAVAGYGSYTLQVGGVTVANVADTNAQHVDAAYIDTQLSSNSVKTALSGAGITVTGTAVNGDLKFTSASGANISVTEGGTGAGSSESLGSFVDINSTPAGNYRLAVSVGNNSPVYLVGASGSGLDTHATQVNAAYIDTQLAQSSTQTSLAAAGISFTGSAAAGTLKFTSSTGQDVQILQDNGSNAALSASTLGSFTALVSGTAGDTYNFSVTSASGTAVNIFSAYDVNANGLSATQFDAQLSASQAALNAAGIYQTGSVGTNDLAFTTKDGSALTVSQSGAQAIAGGFTTNVSSVTVAAATIKMNGSVQGFTNLTGGVTHAENTSVGFTGLTTGVASVTTSSVTLNAASNITVAGNNPATAAGLTAGTVGANHQYTLTVGDGTTSTDLSFDLSKGAFGVSVKATDIASAINNSATLQSLKISASIDANGKLAVTSSDARNITLKEKTSDTVNFGVLGTSGFADSDASADPLAGVPATAVTHMGQVTLNTTKDLTVAGSSPSAAGLTAGSFGGANVLSVTAANATLTEIDSALKTISSTRASLGAYQNRFASTVANLTANAESLTSSRSRIMDADFAAETANLTRGQILQQAGTAMLAQANQLPNGVLALLR